MKKTVLLYRGEKFDPNFYYKTGMDIDNSFYLEKNKEEILVVPKMNLNLAKKIFRRKGKIMIYRKVDEIKKYLGDVVFLDYKQIPLWVYLKIKKGRKIKDISEEFLYERMKKRKKEVERISKAVRIAKEILSGINLKEYKTEEEIKKYLLEETAKRGLELAFEPIVAGDKNSKYPHYFETSKRKIKKMVLVDFGVRYKHYVSDLSRCFFIEENSKERRTYQRLVKILDKVKRDINGKRSGSKVHELFIKLYKKEGLPLPPHSFGHGIGLEVHEYPRINKGSNHKLENTTIALEPAVYTKDFGVRYEENFFIKKEKTKKL